jgi:hypothetical protein
VASNVVGVECSLGTTPLSHLVSTLHRLPDDGCLDQNGEAMLDGMGRLGIRIDRRDLAVPRFQHSSRSHSVQDRPLLGRKSEDRDLLAVRRDVTAQRVFTTDICNVLEAGDAGARNDKRADGNAPQCIPPSSTGVLGRLKGVAEQGGRRKLDLVEACHGEVEGGGTAAEGLADGEDTRVGLASVANRDNEGAHATVFSFDDQAGHDERDLVDAEVWVRGGHKPRRETRCQVLDTSNKKRGLTYLVASSLGVFRTKPPSSCWWAVVSMLRASRP